MSVVHVAGLCFLLAATCFAWKRPEDPHIIVLLSVVALVCLMLG